MFSDVFEDDEIVNFRKELELIEIRKEIENAYKNFSWDSDPITKYDFGKVETLLYLDEENISPLEYLAVSLWDSEKYDEYYNLMNLIKEAIKNNKTSIEYVFPNVVNMQIIDIEFKESEI